MALLTVLLIICAFPLSNAEGRLRKFYYLDNRININTALHACTINYTHLVTVYDQKDNDKLVQILKVKNNTSIQGAWIGVHTNSTNSTNKWSNGDEVTFTNLTGNCNGTCGAAMSADGSWDFFPFEASKHFICYNQGPASRSYILILQNRSWSGAQLYCRQNHTDLASIRNQRENDLAKNAINDSLMTDKCQFSVWIGLLHDNVEWIDGGQSAYRKFASQNTKGHFVLTNSLWLNILSSIIKNTLCYKSFIRVSDIKMSWEDALDFCNSSGPLRIESENDQIETERELRRRKISGPVWVGLRQSRIFGFWIWANGLNLERYQNWKGGRQPEHQKSHHCGAMEKVKGLFKWTDKDCRSKFIALCESP